MKASDNNVEWLHIGKIKYISFLASDVVMYGNGCCLKFFNLFTSEQKFMIANRHCVNGDGIRAVRGHRSFHTFAYAESSRESILYVKEYPSLRTIVAFKDGPPEGYTTIAFSETSLLIALGDIPNFVITIWNWRKKVKLGELTSNITLERQMLRCNWGTPVSMVQLGTGSDKLYLWDVFTCCKTAVLAKHELKFHKDKFKLARFNDCVWSPEDILYVVDFSGCFYRMTTELDLEQEVDVDIKGNIPTSVVFHKEGLAVSGPNEEIRHYVKDTSWECDWKITLEIGVKRMFCNKSDYLVGVTMTDKIVKITKKKFMSIKQNKNKFNDFCVIYPTGECIAALRQNKVLDIYGTDDGKEISSKVLNGEALALAENPELPYVAIGYDNGMLELLSIYKPQQPSVMASFYLTKNKISNIKFFEQGRLIVAGCSDIGEFFIIEGLPGQQMKVITSVHANRQIVDFMLVASKNCYRLFLIPITTNCFAGNRIIRYCIIGKNNVNIKRYHTEDDDIFYHRLLPTRTSTRDRIFYALPFNSRNIHLLEAKRGDSKARIISEIQTGHQMRNFGLHITKYYAVTWGYDGFVIARDNNFEKNVGMSLCHHRYYGGVIKAYIDPLGKYLISLGKENNLICTAIASSKIDEERKQFLTELKQSVKFTLMFKRPTLGYKAEGRFQNKTWVEIDEIMQKERERDICRIERGHILEEFATIKSQLTDLVTKNLEGPEKEKIDLIEFYLDFGLHQIKKRQNKQECKHTEMKLKALITAQDKVTQYMMENYWNGMQVVGQILLGFFVNTMATKYTLLPDNPIKIRRLAWVEEQRKAEKILSKVCFKPWSILSKEEVLDIVRKPRLPITDYSNVKIIKVNEQFDTQTQLSVEAQQSYTGAVTSQYIKPNPGHYSQRELYTFLQSDMQQIIAEYDIVKLKCTYNEMFDELVKHKHREMAFIKERNARLRHILSEFNYFSKNKINMEIVDPGWTQKEQPDRLIKVADYEMTISPYISPSEQAILDAKAAEEERIRLALLADDFKDRALMAMMNGVLEVRWEDELKKDVPVPKCMIEKDPAQFNEEDLRAVRDYEEKVAYLNSERERYKNLLDNEFTKISIHLRDLIRKFNDKVKASLEYKMNIDSATNQENLKVNRIRWKENLRIILMEKEEQLQCNFKNTEGIIEELQYTISSLNEVLNDCRIDLDVYQLKERGLDKAFKKEIQEMSPVVQEQATKLYKKRPKTVFRPTTSSAVLTELARCVINYDRSLLLTEDCLDFLRTLDVMDQFTGMPPTIDEHLHKTISKQRRLRIEFELTVKSLQKHVTDGDATISTYQKRLIMNKEKCIRLQTELKQVKADYIYLIHNIQIQIVLRRGLVEIPLTGSVSDFKDALLIPKKEIIHINQLIKEAGNKKILAIMRNMALRRNMLIREWEHRKLRMLINDLVEHLNDIESVKFTKEMQQYLKAKALGRSFGPDSAESELDKLAKEFKLRVKEKTETYAKLRKQIKSYQNHNDALDKAIQNVNIDVCDLKLQKDEKLDKEESEVIQSRWLHVGSVKYLCFMQTDIVIYGSGCCLKFFNLNSGGHKFLIANCHRENGDGIRAVNGHRTVHIFAYAESSREPLLHVKEYPSMKTIVTLKDGSPEGYTAMTFSETSLLIALGDLPSFTITIWNWRKKEKLGQLTSNIRLERQMVRCNWGSPVSMVQLGQGSDKVYLWDIFLCCRTAVLAKHELKFHKEQFRLARFNDGFFSDEGKLYLVDLSGCFYTMTPELDLELEVAVDLVGNNPTALCYYQSGLAVSGPNNEIRHYVKNASWECDWTISLDVGMRRMFCNKTSFMVGVTMDEKIFKINKTKLTLIKRNKNKFNDICLIYPSGDYVAALRQNKDLDIYSIHDGIDICTTELNGNALALAENPELPYIAIGYDNGILELISIYKPKQPSAMTTFHLTRNKIEDVKFFEQGRLIVAGCSDIGEYFIIEGIPGTQMKVVASVNANCQIVDFMLVASKNCYRLFLIPVTTDCLAGQKIIRYCIITKNNINIKEYDMDNIEFFYCKLIPTTSFTRDRIFYGIPFNSRDIHLLETKRGDPLVRIISVIKTGHQMRHIGLHLTKYYAVTWGYDGFIIVRDNKFEENIGMALPHHRYYGGVKKAYVDPLGRYIISLGRENNLVCTKIAATTIDEERKNYLIELRDSVKYAVMFKRPTIGFKPEGRFQNKTWLEVENILREEKEEEKCRIEKSDILKEFANIKSKLINLVTKNLEGPENEKLNLMEFHLDTGLYHYKKRLNREECRNTEIYLKALIVAQDKVRQHIIDNYWNAMKESGRLVYGFFVNTMVGKYTLLPDNLEQIRRVAWVEEQRKVEKFLCSKGSFMPWYIRTEEEVMKAVRTPEVPREDYKNINVLELINQLDTSSQQSIEAQQAEVGTITAQYIDVSPSHYGQKQICTFYQCALQQSIAENELLKLKHNFNDLFEEVVKQKYRDMAFIIEKNAQLRYIISEFNYFSVNKVNLEIPDPKLVQTEQPEQLTKAFDYEMTVTPYISPSEQAILDAKAAEEERIRLALLADDFKERALMAMMNGVLEVRWEDELRKDVPIPKCMIEKEPEKFNEEDLRAIRDYEEKVAFLHSERERYKNILDSRFTKVSTHVRDLIRKFNQRVKECNYYKMNIDSAANQENLKVNNERWKQNLRIKQLERDEGIRCGFKETEEAIDELRHVISSLTEILNNCRVEMDVYQTKEKVLEKAFKKDIQEMTPIVQELVTKFYKKRPKVALHNIITSAIYVELARCVVAQDNKSLFLTDECFDYLRALDQLDQHIGVPPNIEESTFNIICKHRRLRIEFELMMKASQTQVLEGENTITIYQKRLASNKEKCARLQADCHQDRLDYLYLMHNMVVQIVIRRGLVEIPLTGSINDFKDAILIPKKDVEYINQVIKDAGKKKIRAIMRNMAFRRNIIAKEWEHRRLRMSINDLIEHLHDIDSMTFTKEMQQYLKAKALGRRIAMDSAENELDRIARSYHNRIQEMKNKFGKIKKQIQSYKDHSDALDKAIQNVNVDICDLNLQKDYELKEKEQKIIGTRMEGLIKRSRLVQQIQDNHNEIMILQTELELLRLKRYPTMKFNLINN